MKLTNEDKQKLTFWIIMIVLMVLIGILSGCKSQLVYVPVETIKTEYKDRLQRDSIHLYDSVFVKMKSDTVFFEKYKYLYRDKLIRDSVFVTDSLQVPYPVEVEKEVNRLSSFQHFQIWCGRILLLLVLAFAGYKWIRKQF